MTQLKDKYIRWPSSSERDIRESFESDYGYPGVVGAIDGTHLYITAPLEQPRRYINRHDTFSILARTVCDHKKRYRDVYVGEAGSVGDARMFQRSPLSANLFKLGVLREDEHLIGDQGYTLSDKILIPYPQETQDEKQKHHNMCLSRARSLVERSYALLKEKFPRLRKFRSYNIFIAVKHIMCCFVLHNFILLNGTEMSLNEDVIDQNLTPPTEDQMEESRLRGAVRREYICHMLWNVR